MDNLPCEYVIYVLTVIDDMSHALFSRSLVLPQLSKIRISLCNRMLILQIEFAFSALPLDDGCLGYVPNSHLVDHLLYAQ